MKQGAGEEGGGKRVFETSGPLTWGTGRELLEQPFSCLAMLFYNIKSSLVSFTNHNGCFAMQKCIATIVLYPSCSQISKSYTEGQSLVQQGPLKRGDAVVALIRRLNEDEEDAEEAPQGRGVEREGDEEGAPPAVQRRQPRGWDTSSSKGGAAAPAVGGQRSKVAAAAATAGAAATPDTLRFVLSTRVLEAEEGLIGRSLEEYNSR